MKYRCISFVAVSSAPQAEQVSLSEQAAVNEQTVEQIDGHIIHRLSVPGHTRRYDTLAEIAAEVDAYAQMRTIIEQRNADVLVAYTPDRLARTPALLLDIAQKCWRAGIALYIHSMPPHSLDPAEQARSLTQQLLLAFAGVQAGNEVTTFQTRHRFGMAARVKHKGRFPGMIPYGYMPGVAGEIILDPQIAPVVRWILVDLYLAGLGTGEIAALVNQRGIPTPSVRRAQLYEDRRRQRPRWTHIMVRRLVERAIRYAGFVELNKRGDREYIRAPGRHPAIISEEEAHEIEQERQTRTQGPNATYALSGLCRCGECGATMHIYRYEDQLASGEPAVYMYLHCKSCNHRARYKDVLGALRDALAALWVDQAASSAHAAAVERKRDQLHRQLAANVDQQSRNQAAIGRLLDALEDAAMPQEQIAKRIADRRAALERLEAESIHLRKALTDLDTQPDPAEQAAELNRAAPLLDDDHTDPRQLNQKLSRLLDHIGVHHDGKVTIHL